MSDKTISLAGFDFSPDKATFTCRHVLEGFPVLMFFHAQDGDLSFSCGAEGHSDSDWKYIDIEDVVQLHPYLTELPVVKFGELAERDSSDSNWVVS